MSTEDWRTLLNKSADDFCAFLIEKGIKCTVEGGGDYFVQIRTIYPIKIYSNSNGDRRIVVEGRSGPVEKARLISLWEEFNGHSFKGVNIFVDGSSRGQVSSYAAVIIEDGLVIGMISGCFRDNTNMRNVAGEIVAVEKAVDFCLKKSITAVKIHYDYEGLCGWAEEYWQAKTPRTIEYRKHMREIAGKLSIKWVNIKAHSGSSYNEMADKLARKALLKCKLV